ncbi:RNA 2'-phosphotransferase [Amycolatopsis regifaucium]|uniref:Probable RNA 2'-phosphotransferase n=1 Tax=Amycolatopsis regifaucium TaxID=546365 RepID=A0ABX3DYN0_9PSEU|nr:RNA 2'-phosphotransferase [Amycolatopsis regifaucium]OKA10561.1 RNA--NAD 2'-phosphotransferase [Amycolatopsis regifaucium]SFI82159.1 putative RNA 2'-phosphotransferase [Amycolatopsis regifaucium]
MDKKHLIRASKRLSRHLRHAPGDIGITLTSDGWVEVETLLAALARHGTRLSRAQLDEVVEGNDKRRFASDESGLRIRVGQGHSVDVDLELPAATPPDVLYHGTVSRFLDAILREGLRPMKRHAVHLSATTETARAVGARRGVPVLLTAAVPPEFLRRLP